MPHSGSVLTCPSFTRYPEAQHASPIHAMPAGSICCQSHGWSPVRVPPHLLIYIFLGLLLLLLLLLNQGYIAYSSDDSVVRRQPAATHLADDLGLS